MAVHPVFTNPLTMQQREARQRGGMWAAVVAGGVGMCAVLLVVNLVPRGAGERGELLGVGEQPRMASSLAALAAAEKRQRQSLGAAARAVGFTQPGYDNKHPKGLWGKVPTHTLSHFSALCLHLSVFGISVLLGVLFSSGRAS